MNKKIKSLIISIVKKIFMILMKILALLKVLMKEITQIYLKILKILLRSLKNKFKCNLEAKKY